MSSCDKFRVVAIVYSAKLPFTVVMIFCSEPSARSVVSIDGAREKFLDPTVG